MSNEPYMPEYDGWDATKIADLIRANEISPADALRAAQARVAQRNPQLNAVVTHLDDRAKQTLENLPDGPFRGVPFLVKDLLLRLQGTITTDSTTLRQNWRCNDSSALAQRFEGAGLVVFGKTNTPEFGILGVTNSELRGPARNPWNTDHTPGGSSGGSGAAVAARMVPMAHGGDGGGSIRIPASACGLFGLKPSRGRISSAPGPISPWGGFVQEHVLTRSVRDSAAMLDICAGYVNGDAYTAPPPGKPFSEDLEVDPEPCTVALCRKPFFGDQHDEECLAALEETARLMESLGYTVVDASLPFDRAEMTEAYLMTVAAHTGRDIADAAASAGVEPRAKDFEPHAWALSQIGHAVSASQLVASQRIMAQTTRRIADFMGDHPLVMTPTLGCVPTKIGELDLTVRDRLQLGLLRAAPLKGLLKTALKAMAENSLGATPNTSLFNQTGQPAMSVPLHWSESGLPVGIQFAAAFGQERRLLRVAAQLERARPWAQRTPYAQ